MISTSILEDPTAGNRDGQSRGLSHTRTNSSSSSSSSHLASPIAAAPPFYSNFYGEASASTSQTTFQDNRSFISGDGDSTDSSGQRLGAQFTPSEAAAVAALRKVGSSPTELRADKSFSSVNSSYYSQEITPKPRTNSVRNVPVNSVSLAMPGMARNDSSTTLSGKATSPPIIYKPPPPSAVAATAAAFAARPKESALTKAKMFARQAAKPHLNNSQLRSTSSSTNSKRRVDLTIQAVPMPPGRPSISELSPLARPSKELERIASNFGNPMPLSPMHTGSRDGNKHHLSFRTRKDPHSTVILSSSSSNSKLISDQGSIYSFHPSSPGGMLKALPSLDAKPMLAKDDKDFIAEETWSLLQQSVLPIFNGEGLRTPVEKVNYLVTLYIESRIQQGAQARDIISEFLELTKAGMVKIDFQLQGLADAKFMPRLNELWQFFFSQVLPYWEAVFLPLQLEFEGSGQVLSPKSAANYWGTLLESPEHLNIRRMTLIAFRDWVMIPISDQLQREYSIKSDKTYKKAN